VAAGRRLRLALVAVALCAGLVAAGASGCGPSMRERLVGTWVTGQGAAAGEMEFTADGMMRNGGSAPVRFTVVGDQLRWDAEGETNPSAQIAWTSDDSFTYTVLGKTCSPIKLTYVRKR
jgi:hypothetical protein